MREPVVGEGMDGGGVTGRLSLANVITLGARDFGALRDVSRRVGWPQVTDDGEFAVFELRGILLALFALTKLARDGNAEPQPSTSGIRSTIGVQVESANEVDRLTEHMRAAGARVTKEPVDAEFVAGRSAYLCDPEGTYFEIVWAGVPMVFRDDKLYGRLACYPSVEFQSRKGMSCPVVEKLPSYGAAEQFELGFRTRSQTTVGNLLTLASRCLSSAPDSP